MTAEDADETASKRSSWSPSSASSPLFGAVPLYQAPPFPRPGRGRPRRHPGHQAERIRPEPQRHDGRHGRLCPGRQGARRQEPAHVQHPRQRARGLLATVIMIENAVVEKGTLYVIPEFNASAGRNTKPGDGYPLYFDIPTAWGQKRFRMGNRDASPARPMARPGRLHPLPGQAAPVLHRRPQYQPDLARPARRPADGAGDVRGHGNACARKRWTSPSTCTAPRPCSR